MVAIRSKAWWFWKGGKHWSEVLKDDALTFINQAKSKEAPFFMYLAFNAPHDPNKPLKICGVSFENTSVPKFFGNFLQTSSRFGKEVGMKP